MTQELEAAIQKYSHRVALELDSEHPEASAAIIAKNIRRFLESDEAKGAVPTIS